MSSFSFGVRYIFGLVSVSSFGTYFGLLSVSSIDTFLGVSDKGLYILTGKRTKIRPLDEQKITNSTKKCAINLYFFQDPVFFIVQLFRHFEETINVDKQLNKKTFFGSRVLRN